MLGVTRLELLVAKTHFFKARQLNLTQVNGVYNSMESTGLCLLQQNFLKSTCLQCLSNKCFKDMFKK